MLLCLAQQLAKSLQGMADLLLPVVKEHGDGAQLSLIDAFNWCVRGAGPTSSCLSLIGPIDVMGIPFL